MKPTTLLYGMCAVWIAFEASLNFLKHSGSGVTRKDEGSVRLLWIAIAISCTLAGFGNAFPALRMPATVRVPLFWTGFAMIPAGVLLRIAAILTLRRYFTVDVAIADDHRVIDTGLYGIVRHPSYTGSLLSFLGLGLAMGNWLSLAILAIGPTLAFAHRIRIEERALVGALGESYRAYAARTKRLVPGVF